MKKIILTPNPYRDKSFQTVQETQRILHEMGMETRICLPFAVDRGVALPQDVRFYNLRDELRSADLLICFGGDGTILHASKAAARHRVPILGVNNGTMGFMAELESSELELLRRLKTGDYRIDPRMMLHVDVQHDSRVVFEDVALNDAVVTKGAVARVIQLAVFIDGVEAMEVDGDGAIVCTPTGSTAYSLSAGGPVVEAVGQNIIITPICAHALHAHSTVTTRDRKISIRVGKIGKKSAFLSVDGGKAFRLGADDVVNIQRSQLETKLLRLKNRNFFEIVRTKFESR